MTEKQNQKYAYYNRITWIIYAFLAVTLACVLVLFVARDTEEQFFYGFITIGAAYAFRPTKQYIGKLVFRFTGISDSSDKK